MFDSVPLEMWRLLQLVTLDDESFEQALTPALVATKGRAMDLDDRVAYGYEVANVHRRRATGGRI